MPRSRLVLCAAALTLVAGGRCGPPALAAAASPAVTTVLTSCSFAALKSAIAAGGTVDYGVSCSSPPVSFTSTISVPAGLTADIEASGHSVTFDRRGASAGYGSAARSSRTGLRRPV